MKHNTNISRFILKFAICFLQFAFNLPPFGWNEGGLFSQQCNIIYVTPNGASSGTAGTISNPADLAYGLSLANSASSQVWMASGTYTISQELTMKSDITLEGGFDPVTWEKSNWNTTLINRNNLNVTPAPDRIIAVACINISNFRLQDLTIRTANATGSGVSTYGVYLDGCSDFSIVRCTILAGNGSNGNDGSAGTTGSTGVIGSDGQDGDENGGCCTAGGNGGGSSFPGSNTGGKGGNGGPRGSGNCPWPGGSAPSGLQGNPGYGPGPGAGGPGGQGYCGAISIGCDAGPANWGGNGTNGSNGINGIDGNDGISFLTTFFIPGNGQNGLSGTNGSGGGGGGGGGSQGCLITCFGNNNGAGPGGGGGGEGGQGGLGATGGTGGGGSFGIYLVATGANADIKDCFISSGMPGMGGSGGFPGGGGGGGGLGGAGGGPNCDIGTGGDGGTGGTGGEGGIGGSGAPGLSLPIYEDPNAASSNQSDIRSAVEPQVVVKSTGCTFSDIFFSTNSIGIIQWYFDGGTIPLTAVGNTATVQYSSMSRHSVTLVVDGVPYILSDFIGIFSDGTPYLPKILSADTLICPGNSANFISSYTGLTYQWNVYDNTVQSYTTPAVSHTFNAPGNYLTTLQTTSPCCGSSKIDSFYLEVAPILAANLYVTASTASSCLGEPITFGAMPVNGGQNPTYEWFVNGSATGITSSSYSNSFLFNGDAITCEMTSSYPCIVNSPATSIPITVTINPLPAMLCNATGEYLGANTSFSSNIVVGTPPYAYLWGFGDASYDTSAAPKHTYGGTGTYIYGITVTDANGCSSSCFGTVTIIIPPYVYAGFDTSAVVMICNSTTCTFTDTSLGNPVSWLWDFGDGSSSTLQNPQHTYTVPGAYTVTLIASNGIYSDTVTSPNLVMILPSPVAGISARDRTACTPLYTQFMDASEGATSWLWDFGDGTTATQQNPNHTFITPGYYDITLRVENAYGCYDTKFIDDYITVYPRPVADFSENDTSICINEFIVFTDNSFNAISWEWDFGDGGGDIMPSPVHTYSTQGIYPVRLTVTNVFGCRDSLEKKDLIYVWPKPVVKFFADPNPTIILSPEIKFTDQSENEPSVWGWYFGDGDTSSSQNTLHTYRDTGKYYVWLHVENIYGCRDSTLDSVKVNPEYIFFVPNTFTPNGDAVNDIFLPKFVGIKPSGYDLYLFNRWGEEVFESHDINKGWDGSLSLDRSYISDVYVWRIKTVDMMGGHHEYVGHVMLLR